MSGSRVAFLFGRKIFSCINDFSKITRKKRSENIAVCNVLLFFAISISINGKVCGRERERERGGGGGGGRERERCGTRYNLNLIFCADNERIRFFFLR